MKVYWEAETGCWCCFLNAIKKTLIFLNRVGEKNMSTCLKEWCFPQEPCASIVKTWLKCIKDIMYSKETSCLSWKSSIFFLKIAQRRGKHHPCHKSCNKNTRKLLFSHSSGERLLLRRFYSLNVRSETLNYVYWTHIREINATWKEKDLNFSVTIYLYLHFTMNWNFYSANHAKD